MNVTIIGAGRMAHGIGTRVLAGGHAVTIIDRHPEHAQRLVVELNHARPGNGGRTSGTWTPFTTTSSCWRWATG